MSKILAIFPIEMLIQFLTDRLEASIKNPASAGAQRLRVSLRALHDVSGRILRDKFGDNV